MVGLDLVQERAALAVSMGATAATTSEEEFRDLCFRHSNGYGADSVLITAETPSSTSGQSSIAEVARDRGIVVAVGAVGMELERRRYYEKELDFRVSRSYGPGRYDATFEQKGIDYPIGHVRWTETRNMEAFLQLLAEQKMNVKSLITHRYEIENAASAYDLIAGKRSSLIWDVMIQYPAGQKWGHGALNWSSVSGAIFQGWIGSRGIVRCGKFCARSAHTRNAPIGYGTDRSLHSEWRQRTIGREEIRIRILHYRRRPNLLG